MPHVFKKRMQKELAREEITNPNKLKYTYNFQFDDDTNLNHSNTEVSDGALILETGEDAGIMTSDAMTLPEDITQVELKFKGKDLNASTFKVNTNNGIGAYETLTKNTAVTVTSGKRIKLKVTLNRDSDNTMPTVDSVALLLG